MFISRQCFVRMRKFGAPRDLLIVVETNVGRSAAARRKVSRHLRFGLSSFICIIVLMDDPNKITYFAETDSRGKRVPFGVKSSDRSKHFYVIGKTGMGKSTLLENMAIQDIRNGNGLCFIDPHGGTAEKLLEYIPEERVKDVLYFAPFDIEHPVAFNVMEDVGPEKRHLVISGLMSAYLKLFGEESFSDRMQYILQNTILALLEYPGSTMLGINKMLSDKTYRNKVIANITDPSVKAYWTQEYAGYTERFAAEAIPAIQNKIGQFTSNPLIRNIIGQPKSSFNFREIMDEKKIMIVNLSKGRVGEGNARLLGSMLMTKIYLAAMSRAEESNTSLAKLPPFYVFVDEFQSFADKSFADILSEARKYKLCLTMAHQYIEQMEEEVRDAVFGNVGTMITFRVGAYDAEVLEKEFAPAFTAEDLVNLGLRQIYLKLMIDSVASAPFSASTLPPLALQATTFVPEIIDYSRRTFARPRSVVEKGISEWHNEGKEEYKAPAPAPAPAPTLERKAPRLIERKEPRAIDTRSLAKEKPRYEPRHEPRDNRGDRSVSLDKLKITDNNQRKPDVKNVSALRDVLKAMVSEVKTETKPVEEKKVHQDPPKPKPEPVPSKPAHNGPTPDELKKLLGVE